MVIYSLIKVTQYIVQPSLTLVLYSHEFKFPIHISYFFMIHDTSD